MHSFIIMNKNYRLNYRLYILILFIGAITSHDELL